MVSKDQNAAARGAVRRDSFLLLDGAITKAVSDIVMDATAAEGEVPIITTGNRPVELQWKRLGKRGRAIFVLLPR